MFVKTTEIKLVRGKRVRRGQVIETDWPKGKKLPDGFVACDKDGNPIADKKRGKKAAKEPSTLSEMAKMGAEDSAESKQATD